MVDWVEREATVAVVEARVTVEAVTAEVVGGREAVEEGEEGEIEEVDSEADSEVWPCMRRRRCDTRPWGPSPKLPRRHCRLSGQDTTPPTSTRS